MSFGRYPEVTLAEVRALHADARRLLSSGADPMGQRKAERKAESSSFRVIASMWHEHWKTGISDL